MALHTHGNAISRRRNIVVLLQEENVTSYTTLVLLYLYDDTYLNNSLSLQ